jgi:hypothetical protein
LRFGIVAGTNRIPVAAAKRRTLPMLTLAAVMRLPSMRSKILATTNNIIAAPVANVAQA